MTRLHRTALPLLLAAALTTPLAGCHKAAKAPPAAAAPPPAVAATATPTTPVPPPPQLAARAFILMDHDSGRVLAALEPDTRQEPASLTKLMTAYGVFKALKEGRIHLNDMVTVSEHAWRQEGSRMFIDVGSQVSVENLIQGMIVQSGNDATVALAEHVAGTEPTFVQMMNTYAKQLGMSGSHFMNAAGMPDPEHYMSARDAATLSSALIREFPEYYHWYSQHEFKWNGIAQPNRNGLLYRDPSVDGLKTGHTDSAGFCLVASAKRNGMRLVAVVMGTNSMKAREDADAALLDYGFNFYETKQVLAANQPMTSVHVWKAASPEVGLTLHRDLYVTSQRGQPSNVKQEIEVPEVLVAPLAHDRPVGKAKVLVNGALAATYDLYPAQDVPAGGIFRRALDTVRLWFHH
ncbi:MAG TPA: D-alanyl-D-alanine carboxypeptidase family protein [Steroidobacteraceae bacterium]|nr:D-alanyl-D-alanine carboxypeptidase family protein [Steroidobacteraceae bacterium]